MPNVKVEPGDRFFSGTNQRVGIVVDYESKARWTFIWEPRIKWLGNFYYILKYVIPPIKANADIDDLKITWLFRKNDKK